MVGIFLRAMWKAILGFERRHVIGEELGGVEVVDDVSRSEAQLAVGVARLAERGGISEYSTHAKLAIPTVRTTPTDSLGSVFLTTFTPA